MPWPTDLSAVALKLRIVQYVFSDVAEKDLEIHIVPNLASKATIKQCYYALQYPHIRI